MQNNNLKLKIIFLIAAVFCIGLISLNYEVVYQKIIPPVLAEDDEEDEEDDEEDDDHFEVIDTNPSNNTTQKNETKTIKTKLSDTVTQTTTTTIRHDSDGDGKYDDEDPHPTINEYFIVKDDDLNGIDDQYEPR